MKINFLLQSPPFWDDRRVIARNRLALALLLLGTFRTFAQVELQEITNVLQQAIVRAREISPTSIIAIVDREGYVLAVWQAGAAPSNLSSAVASAISKAGTAAFLSSNEEALTSRSAGFIVQQHFPPGVSYKPPGPLVGVNFSNLPFSDVNRFKDPSTFDPSLRGGTNGAPIPGTSLAGSPGGVPLYRRGKLIGGIGVSGDGSENIQVGQASDRDEDVALAGQVGHAPDSGITANQVFIDGLRVPYVVGSGRETSPVLLQGQAVASYTITASPPVVYPTLRLGSVVGEVRSPIRADPLPGFIRGQGRLSAAEVRAILRLAAERARITRAGIRLPRGRAAQVFISVVNNPDTDGVAPEVLGTFRTPDATIFSWDVSVQKARTALFFSSDEFAASTRAVGFLAQSTFPPGIDRTAPGLFYGLQEKFSGFQGANSLNGVVIQAAFPVNPALPNGITIFPGGFPLYRKGVLIGAIGISGDGIDQDDLIGISGAVPFQAPPAIRSDRFQYRGARLPYVKFPRNPAI